MSQPAIESLFGGDPFFEDAASLLWSGGSVAQGSLREHFLRRRAQLLGSFGTDVRDRLTREMCEGLPESLLQTLDLVCPVSLSTTTGPGEGNTPDQTLAVTLDTQGFSPEDITVTVSGRRLEVTAGRASDAYAQGSTDCTPAGFVQSVELPPHIDPTRLTCTQAGNGLLCIQSESEHSLSEERLIPIRFRTSLNFPLAKDSTQTAENSATSSNLIQRNHICL